MLATQTLRQMRALQMRVDIDGLLPAGVHAKDVILHVIGRLGASGAVGHAIEYAGDTVRRMGMPPA